MLKFFEVEVSDDEQTVSCLFADLTSAQAYADDCAEIPAVRLIQVSGPYRVYDKESVAIAYARTWNVFNKLKGE
jgi:ABC-type hemin transport system ATPase subunit